MFQHETDGKHTNLLADIVTEIPIGNRKDLVESMFRDAFFQEPNEEATKAIEAGDFRLLKFVGEDNAEKDTIDTPFGHFIFEARLKGIYQENPPREGLPSRLDATFLVYRNKDDENKYLIVLELANPNNLEGGLIYVFTAREIPHQDIK